MNNELEELRMIDLNPVNILLTISEITILEPLPQPSTNMRSKQSCMSGSDTTYIQFSNTPKDKFWYQLALIQKMQYTPSNNKKVLNEEIEVDFISSKEIDLCKQVLTLNRHPHHDLPQTFRGRKFIFTVWIWPTENLQRTQVQVSG